MSPERWLVIETSGRSGSVAIGSGDRIESRPLTEGRRHARDLTLAVADLLKVEAISARELTGVIVGQGPGSFTGLRVGLMSAKTLAFAMGCRLIAVPTFLAIAEQAPIDATSLEVIADAQQGQLYVQRYRRPSSEDSWVAMADLAIRPLEEWALDVHSESWLTGPGVDVYADRMPTDVRLVPEADRQPRAESVYTVGRELARRGVDTNWAEVEPLYLRGSYAEEQSKNSGKK